MKTQLHNSEIKDWQQYRENPALHKDLEKKFSSDDLNYLATKGFEKGNISSADVKEIHQRINSRTFGTQFLNSVLIGGLVAIVFSGLFFTLMKKEETTTTTIASTKQPIISTQVNTPAQKQEIKDSLKDNPTQVPNHWKKEHFSIIPEQAFNESALQSEKKEMVDMNIHNINSIPVEEKKLNLAQLPNAPVVYIKNLKVTNFQFYYFKNNQPFQLINGGLAADYNDVYEYKAGKKELKEGDRTTADAVLREAMENFANQDYSNCLAALEILLKLDKTDVNANFYSAMSYYFLGKYANAAPYFENVIQHPNNIFDQESEYYKALCLKKTGSMYEAEILFKKIASDNGFYASRALEELRK